ncbi:MAG: ABC transporter permease subunit [Pseudomonadota bacterium]
MSLWARYGLRAAGILAVLVIWELVGRRLGDALLAPPSAVLAEFPDLFADGEMLPALAGSLRQMMIGYLLALAIGIPLGVAMGRSRLIDVVVHPWASMFIVMSAAALVPLFLVVFGRGLVFRSALVLMATVWYVTLTVYQGARGLPPQFLDVARAFGASRLKTFRAVILPALYPYLLIAARLGLIHALRAMVVAEMFVLVGFGGLISEAGNELSMAPLLALIVILMAVSLAAGAALTALGRWSAPWYESRMAPSE